jgi:hypothetical protein
MVERSNGRFADVLTAHRLASGEELTKTIERQVWLNSRHLPQLAPHQTPRQAMKTWQGDKPE